MTDMVYTYLLNLYQALDSREMEINGEMSKLANNAEQIEFLQGRIDTINEIRSFIQEKYHRKLPRRIQKLHAPASRKTNLSS